MKKRKDKISMEKKETQSQRTQGIRYGWKKIMALKRGRKIGRGQIKKFGKSCTPVEYSTSTI